MSAIITGDLTLKVLGSLVLPMLVALTGLKKAIDLEERIDWVIFFKTILIGLVTGGVISAASSGVLLAIFSTGLITWILDSAVNALINKTERTKKVL